MVQGIKMGKIIETYIKTFDGGIANDVRDPRKDKCRMVTNFDIVSSTRMTPYRDSESGDTAAATSQKQNFCIAYWTPATAQWKIFSLGVKSGAGTAEVLMKQLDDLADNSWDTPAVNQSASGGTSFNLFVYYHKTGKIYGARAGTHIWAFALDGSTAWDDTENALAYTNIAQGLVHSKDDILYIPYDNKIAKNDNGVWTNAALTLPTHYKINSICEFGNYLAIAAAPLSGIGNSRVFLWNMDSDTWDEEIDWGEGALKILEEVEGYLVGISHLGANVARFNDRITFKYLSGNKAVKYDELIADVNDACLLPIAKQKANGRLFFMLDILIDGVEREGVWSFGRSLIEPNFTIVHERTPDDDVALSGGVLKSFFIVEDYMFISFVNAGSDFQLTKTNDASSYTATSSYEKLFNTVDSQTTKKLLGVSVTFADLPTNAQVVLKYKIDENIPSSTWVTVFTHAVASSIRHSAINIESTGATLPTYKEIMFRIESTKGAEITGLKFLEETIDDDLLKI